jgi:periplasmic protein CpxP/Spy
MKYKFDFKLILGTVAIASAITLTGCQSSSTGVASTDNSATKDVAANTSETSTAPKGDRYAYLNLTDAQKAQVKQIQAQNVAKIVPLLSKDKQDQFKAATADNKESPMKALRELNLSDEEKQKVREVLNLNASKFKQFLLPNNKPR